MAQPMSQQGEYDNDSNGSTSTRRMHSALDGRGIPAALVQGDGDPGSTVEWETPNDIFDACDAKYGPFTLDPASALGYHTSNVILGRGGSVITLDGWFKKDKPGYTPIDRRVPQRIGIGDGLACEWTGRVWLNHPYGRLDWKWIKKAHDSVRYGDAEIVVALVPVKTQMKWWHKYVGLTDIVRVQTPHTYRPTRQYGGSPDDDTWSDARTVMLESWNVYAAQYPGARGADERHDIRGRLRFGGAPSSAPFNNAIIVWRR